MSVKGSSVDSECQTVGQGGTTSSNPGLFVQGDPQLHHSLSSVLEKSKYRNQFTLNLIGTPSNSEGSENLNQSGSGD